MPRPWSNPCRFQRCPKKAVKSGYCTEHAATYDERRGSPASRGYDAGWKKLRDQVLKAEPTCRRCGRAQAAMVDHIIPKRLGGTDDIANLQPLCRGCHDEKTRKEDGRWQGAPTSRVVVAAGPPGAGKSTFIRSMFREGDLLVDVDRLFVALSGLEEYDKPGGLLPFAMEARDAVLRRLVRPSSVARAWVVAGAPTTGERDRLQRMLSAQVLVFETPAAECIRRIAADPRRAARAAQWEPLVRDWWTTYRRRATGDVVMPHRPGATA